MTQIETTEEKFKQKIESSFADMTKEEIIASLVSHVTSRCRLIKKWEKLAFESKRKKDEREWMSMASDMRMERLLITHLSRPVDLKADLSK